MSYSHWLEAHLREGYGKYISLFCGVTCFKFSFSLFIKKKNELFSALFEFTFFKIELNILFFNFISFLFYILIYTKHKIENSYVLL